MNKVKRFLSFTFLAMATTSLAAGGAVLSTSSNSAVLQSANASWVQGEITQGTNDFLLIDDNHIPENDNNIHFAGDVDFSFSLDVDGSSDPFKKSLSDGRYIYFDLFSPTITVNGRNLNITDFNFTSIVERSTNTTHFIASDLVNDFNPAKFDFTITTTTTDSAIAETSSFNKDSKTLTIGKNDYGLFNFTIMYTAHYAHKDESYDVQESTENGTINYSFYVLDKNNYESDTTHAPKITYSNLDIASVASTSDVLYNYYSNYQRSGLPKLSYDSNYIKITITKDSTYEVVYDPEKQEITNVEQLKEILYDVRLNDEQVELYFENIGVYNLRIDYLYTVENTLSTSEQKTYTTYTLDHDLLNIKAQNVHIFGAQLQYRDKATDTFKEFKKISENYDITDTKNSADVTWLYDTYKESDEDPSFDKFLTWLKTNLKPEPDSTYTPAMTNQSSIKFDYLLNDPTTVEYYKYENGEWSDNPTNTTIINQFNLEGKYLVHVQYQYVSYLTSTGATASNTQHNQYFYFEVKRQAPEINVFIGNAASGKQIKDNGYTNQALTIQYPDHEAQFNSPITITLTRRDFTSTNATTTEDITQELVDNGTKILNANGNYTLSCKYGSRTDQVAENRKFNIDNTAIADSAMAFYAVENGKVTSSQVYDLTNQSFVFSYDMEKPSGAQISGYMRFFSLDHNSIYDNASSNSSFTTFISNFLNDHKSLPADKTLNLATGSTWNLYNNARSYLSSGVLGEEVEVNSLAGLYLFETKDEAGNTSFKLILLDDTTPKFIIQTGTSDNLSYQVANQYQSVTTDANVIWGEKKAIKVSGKESAEIYKDYDDALASSAGKNSELKELIDSFFESFKTYTISSNSELSGSYYEVEILDRYYFKSKDQIESGTVITDSKTNRRLRSSYTIHFTKNSGVTTFYVSSPDTNNYYKLLEESGELESLADGSPRLYRGSSSEGQVTIENITLQDALIYRIDNDYYFRAENGDTLYSIKGGVASGINEASLAAEKFVDMEGTYQFVLRDAANTRGINLSAEIEQFLNYPSAYLYLHISADSSQTKINNTNYGLEQPETAELDSSSFYTISSRDESGKTLSIRNTFYNPVSSQDLTVSFIPTTILANEKKVQIDKVELKYYPFITVGKVIFNRNKLPSAQFYRTLGDEQVFELYKFEDNQESTETVTIDLNKIDGITQPGKYVLTRTYKFGDDYERNKFDYDERTFTAVNDTTNVISQAENVSIIKKAYTYTLNDKTTQITLTQIGNVFALTSTGDMPDLIISIDGSEPEETGGHYTPTEETSTSGETRYYYFDKNVDEIKDFKVYELISGGDVLNPLTNGEPTPKQETTLENIVGGDIFVNMYDGGDIGSVVSVSFPYHGNDLMGNAEGYVDENETADAQNRPLFKTNKLPVRVYIPEVKYTLYNEEQNTDKSTEFSSNFNGALTNYDGNLNNALSRIDYYRLTATIQRYENGVKVEGDVITATVGSNGFLKFGDNGLTKAGVYVVTITQGASSISGTVNDFRKDYSFAFEIKKSAPEFDVLNQDAPITSVNKNGTETYYTNSKEVSLVWRDYIGSGSNALYNANIDKRNITLEFKNPNALTNRSIKANVDLSGSDIAVKVEGDDNDGSLAALVKNMLTYTTSTIGDEQTNTLAVKFMYDELNFYSLGSTLDVTMQFEGHNDDYYKPTKKQVYIDNQADFTTIDSLISDLQNLSTNALSFDSTTMRKYMDINGQTTTNGQAITKENAAYNVSQSSGNEFNRYSYLVTRDFFESLYGKARQNGESAKYDGAINIYYKEVADPYLDINGESNFEVDPLTLSSSSLNSNYLLLNDSFTPTPKTYYEIVESDLAGNLTIYLVYIYEADSSDGSEEQIEQGIWLSDANLNGGTERVQKYASDAQIAASQVRTLDLYGSTSVTLENINYLADNWVRFKVDGKDYMFSPWRTGWAYDLSGAAPAWVELSSILPTQTTLFKTISIQIADKPNKNFIALNLTVADVTTLSILPSISADVEEYISIPYTTNLYPVKVQVYVGSGTDSLAAEFSNNPDALSNLTANYAYASVDAWKVVGTMATEIEISVDLSSGRIRFKFVNRPERNTKIKYVFTDNFGKTYKPEAHLFGYTIDDPITSSGNRYVRNNYQDATTEGKFVDYYIGIKDISYRYNSSIYPDENVEVYLYNGGWQKAVHTASGSGVIKTLNFTLPDLQGSAKYKVVLTDSDTDEVKEIYLQVYNMLPSLWIDAAPTSYIKFADGSGSNITENIFQLGELARDVTIGGKTYRVDKAGSTYAETITVTYTNSRNFDFPFTLYVYPESGKIGNQTFTDFVDIAEVGSDFSESGVYYFMAKYNELLDKEQVVYKVQILDYNNEYYRVMHNGKVINRASSKYYDGDGAGFSDYYIVNSSYNNEVYFILNTYQGIEATKVETIDESSDDGNFAGQIKTIHYTLSNKNNLSSGISPKTIEVYVTYIPPESHPVATAYYTLFEPKTYSLFDTSLTTAAATAVASNDTIDSVKIVFSQYYAIKSNKIKISVKKDDVPYPVEVKTLTTTTSPLYYIELFKTGTYSISFEDESGNEQQFQQGASSFKLTFLKDVAFSMNYTNVDGSEMETDPIQNGVFNGQVTLNVLNLQTYYDPQDVGGGENMLHATRNGVEYKRSTNNDGVGGYIFNAKNTSFTFSEPGYYSVYFSARSKASAGSANEESIKLREIVYNFVVVSPDESRYSFELTPYKDYFIESVEKDNVGEISKLIKEQFPNLAVNSDGKLQGLLTSFIYDKGFYTVVVNTMERLNRNDYTSSYTTFSFKYRINSAPVPITISINEGEETTKNIQVSFNASEVFSAVGECNIQILNERIHVSSDSVATLGVVNRTITTPGTFYIKAYSMSGNELYSFKVIKKEPLNGWAIAAIVIACVVAVAVVIIIIKLRKRIKVK